jgi:hypothetical protein
MDKRSLDYFYERQFSDIEVAHWAKEPGAVIICRVIVKKHNFEIDTKTISAVNHF